MPRSQLIPSDNLTLTIPVPITFISLVVVNRFPERGMHGVIWVSADFERGTVVDSVERVAASVILGFDEGTDCGGHGVDGGGVHSMSFQLICDISFGADLYIHRLHGGDD